MKKLESLLKARRVVTIGECGLDDQGDTRSPASYKYIVITSLFNYTGNGSQHAFTNFKFGISPFILLHEKYPVSFSRF